MRNGNYTIFQNQHLTFFPVRKESNSPLEMDEYFVCALPNQDKINSEFERHQIGELRCVVIKENELTNAYSVRTHGEYKGLIVEVFEFKPDPKLVSVMCSEESTISTHGFIDLVDGRFGNEVNRDQLSKVWEIRKECELDVPLPKGLEYKVEIR